MRRWVPWLVDLPLVVAFVALVHRLLVTVGPRLAYPFDLEWMEGGMLVHALRVSQGLPLYTEPSADWIPYLYPPLYPWLLGGLGLVTGVDYTVGRLVSLVGVGLACLALVAALRREGGSPGLGLGAAALFLSTYEDSGTFFDLVRADGLLVALLGGALVLVRRGWLATGGLLLVLAFLAKHNAAAFGLPMLGWLWWARGRGPALRFAAWSVLPALLVVGLLQWRSDGLFLVYLLEVPARHPFVLERFFPGAPRELVMAMPAAVALLPLAPLLARLPAARPGGEEARQGAVYWALQGGLAFLLCMLMRGHHGGFLNVLVPGHWALALAAGLAALALRRAFPHPAVALLTSLLLAGQAWQARWEVGPQQPTPADVLAGEELVARLRSIEGEVLMPHAPWYPVLAGKAPSFPLIALWDVDHGGRLSPFAQRVDQAIAARRWAAIIVPDGKLGHGLAEHYQVGETLRYTGRAFYPKTGWPVRPRLVYLPRP